MEEIILHEENLATRIYFVRGEKVMMDLDFLCFMALRQPS